MISDAHFDAMLDEYQEREYERAQERSVIADEQAIRPDARRMEIEFGALEVGDFMTNERGPLARWVEIVKIEAGGKYGKDKPDYVTVTLETPQPLGVGYENHWVIERTKDTLVTIDATVRMVA